MGGPSMVRRLVFCTASDGGRQRYFLCWLVLVWLSPLRSDASSFTPWVESTCRVEASNFLFAKKKVTKEIAWERGVAGRYIGPSIHFASLVPLSAWPSRINRSAVFIARESGRSFAKSFTLCHRPRLIDHRRTVGGKHSLAPE